MTLPTNDSKTALRRMLFDKKLTTHESSRPIHLRPQVEVEQQRWCLDIGPGPRCHPVAECLDQLASTAQNEARVQTPQSVEAIAESLMHLAECRQLEYHLGHCDFPEVGKPASVQFLQCSCTASTLKPSSTCHVSGFPPLISAQILQRASVSL